MSKANTLVAALILAATCAAPVSALTTLPNGEVVSTSDPDTKKRRPLSGQQRAEQQIMDALESAKAAWVPAMEAMGDPYILLYVNYSGDSSSLRGIDHGPSTPRRRRPSTSTPAFDSTAFISGLETQLGAYMMDAYADTQLIDAEEVLEVKARIAGDMKDAGHEAMVARIMRDVDADMSIHIELTPIQDQQYRVNTKISDPRTGRITPIGSYTIVADQVNPRPVASAMFDKIAQTTFKMTTRKAPKYDVVLVGDIGDKDFRGLNKKVAELEYVENKNKVRMQKGTDFFKLRGVQYDGDQLDLGYDIADLLTEEYGVRAKVVFSEGDVTIEVYENTEPPAWYMLTDSKANDQQDLFRALYSERGSPRVAVFTQSPVGLSQSIENEIIGMMMNAGVDVVDGGQLRTLLGSNGLVMDDEQVLAKLRDMGGFDVLVMGTATPGPSGIGSLTYRATMVETGVILGTRAWPSSGATEDPDYRVDPVNPDPQDLARFLSGSVLDMFMRNHLVNGTSFSIRVAGVSSFRQAGFISSSIQSVVPGVISVSNVRLSDDVANFTLRYEGSMQELISALQESIDSLPIETKIESAGADSLKVRAKQLNADG